MMWWWNDSSQGEGWPWWMLMHGIGPVLLLALLVGGVILLVRFVGGGDGTLQKKRSTALEILEERYARGEINRDEYLQKKHDIGNRAEAI